MKKHELKIVRYNDMGGDCTEKELRQINTELLEALSLISDMIYSNKEHTQTLYTHEQIIEVANRAIKKASD